MGMEENIFLLEIFFHDISLLWASLPDDKEPLDEMNHLNCSNHFCFCFWIFFLILELLFSALISLFLQLQ